LLRPASAVSKMTSSREIGSPVAYVSHQRVSKIGEG
jgi:hypothetical protein